MRSVWGVVAGGVLLCLAVPVVAQTGNSLSMLPGTQTVITLNETFDSVSVGNPEIVDVLPKSDRVFVIVGKKVGTADIVAFSLAKPIFRTSVSVGELRPPSRVFNHSGSKLETYTAYECNPNCIRVKDEFAVAPGQTQTIFVEGGRASSNFNVIVPPNQGGGGAR